MKNIMRTGLFLLFWFIQFNLFAAEDSLHWVKRQNSSFTLYYTSVDSTLVYTMEKELGIGTKTVTDFFHSSFKEKYEVYIFPNRNELDRQWSKDWAGPNFKSQCWMVASGVARRLDILSPICWKKDACEHNAADNIEVEKIITHELVHVFHAQHNPHPNFDGMDDLSWLIEGLATFVSGQLNEERINKVRTQLKEGKTPTTLSQLWTGADKYGRAGCFVQFLEKKYGRKKIIELLSLTDLNSILKILKTDEETLITTWKNEIIE
jgi:hypothetical protein